MAPAWLAPLAATALGGAGVAKGYTDWQDERETRDLEQERMRIANRHNEQNIRHNRLVTRGQEMDLEQQEHAADQQSLAEAFRAATEGDEIALQRQTRPGGRLHDRYGIVGMRPTDNGVAVVHMDPTGDEPGGPVAKEYDAETVRSILQRAYPGQTEKLGEDERLVRMGAYGQEGAQTLATGPRGAMSPGESIPTAQGWLQAPPGQAEESGPMVVPGGSALVDPETGQSMYEAQSEPDYEKVGEGEALVEPGTGREVYRNRPESGGTYRSWVDLDHNDRMAELRETNKQIGKSYGGSLDAGGNWMLPEHNKEAFNLASHYAQDLLENDVARGPNDAAAIAQRAASAAIDAGLSGRQALEFMRARTEEFADVAPMPQRGGRGQRGQGRSGGFLPPPGGGGGQTGGGRPGGGGQAVGPQMRSRRSGGNQEPAMDTPPSQLIRSLLNE